MVDERLKSAGNLRLKAFPPTAFTNYKWPTVTQANSGTDLEDVVLWEDYGFGVQASETTSQPAVSAKSATETRGQANYGGTMSFPYPGAYADNGNQLSRVYDVFQYPWTELYIATSVDGEIGEVGQPALTMAFANGDYMSLYKIKTDAWSDMTEGDDPLRYTINMLKSGGLAHYTVVSTTAPVLAVTPATATGTVAAKTKVVLKATVNGREYTRGVVWTTSNAAVATVSAAGVVTVLSAGAATITASVPGTTTSVTQTMAVTVTA